MGAVTYPSQDVVDFVNANFIPLKFDSARDQKRLNEFNAQWTPTIIIYDQNQKEHHRTTGYLSPETFLSEMRLGLAKMEYDLKRYNEALQAYKQVIQAYPETAAAPEALYFSGVCNYMATHDPSHLKETFTALKEKYPRSDWTRKAEVWS